MNIIMTRCETVFIKPPSVYYVCYVTECVYVLLRDWRRGGLVSEWNGKNTSIIIWLFS